MRTYKAHVLMIAIICIAIVLITCTLPTMYEIARAEDLTSTNVLYDLQRDPNFNQGDYPANDRSNVVELIQIAESDTSDLYVYVYQPNYENDELNPFEIAISRAQDDEEDKFEQYPLTLVNSYKTLFKYKVEDLKVSNEEVRYYNISQMWRKHIESIDKELDTDNAITATGIEVAQKWGARTVDDTVEYAMTEVDVVIITDAFVGCNRFWDGLDVGAFLDKDKATYLHYIAFSTDHQIDRLIEAEIHFKQREVIEFYKMEEFQYGDWIENTVVLYEHNQATNHPFGWFATKYEWKSISSSEEFIAQDDITFKDGAKEAIEKQEWVLYFLESQFVRTSGGILSGIINTNPYSYLYEYTEVEDVAILRLKFETDGQIYNLGVVSDKQTGSGIPTNKNPDIIPDLDDFGNMIKEWLDDYGDTLMTIVIVIACVLGGILIFWGLFKILSSSKTKTVYISQNHSKKIDSRARARHKKIKKKTGGKR